MNKAILIGRLTKDPELRFTQNGSPYCQFTVACDRPSKDGDSKEADFIEGATDRCRGQYPCRQQRGERSAKVVHEGERIPH